jgi:hypothetical protein
MTRHAQGAKNISSPKVPTNGEGLSRIFQLNPINTTPPRMKPKPIHRSKPTCSCSQNLDSKVTKTKHLEEGLTQKE